MIWVVRDFRRFCTYEHFVPGLYVIFVRGKPARYSLLALLALFKETLH